ncbi:hypothetical protein ABEI56_05555 [Peribacillus castrilensis]|uniref:hypothetical protein n=1 Tax=Peribacillus castrilensis TaxID=2897690 RepID=UPI003D29F676
MIKKFFKKISARKEYPEFNEKLHKLCDECGGGGIDFIAGPCIDCDGNGFIEKTRKDIWDEKINH